MTSLGELAGSRHNLPITGLRTGEADTIIAECRGASCLGPSSYWIPPAHDESLVADWAEWSAPFDLAPRLDPWVGSVKGIGPALYVYLRMRSGGDGIKPDVRVRARLTELGFRPPPGDGGLLLTAWAAAEELGVRRLELDQLLW